MVIWSNRFPAGFLAVTWPLTPLQAQGLVEALPELQEVPGLVAQLQAEALPILD